MNLNCKLTLTDEQRNNIKRHLAGKNVKGLATRADVCQLVQHLLEPFLEPPRSKPNPRDGWAAHDIEREEREPVGQSVPVGMCPGDELDFCSDECCKQNQLLVQRVNTLQHRLDTNAK